MNACERVAFNQGVESVRQAAFIIALTIEAQDGSQGPRQQAAVAALQALAEGAKDLMLSAPHEPQELGKRGVRHWPESVARVEGRQRAGAEVGLIELDQRADMKNPAGRMAGRGDLLVVQQDGAQAAIFATAA